MVGAVSVCPSVHLSATNRYSTKMAAHRITKTLPHDSTGTYARILGHMIEHTPYCGILLCLQ